ncbi:MAG: Trk family potassium uptake protein [Ruminococcaceae bacterium]|nr:Trk family potassium uptake protein [Oscillospiraceae bacterium]
MRKLRFSQTQIIALGFFLIIALGTLLLMLPISTRNGEGATFREALFTATSSSCVTGLVLQDTYSYWTGFGQVVLLLLIQLGGLGFMTIATLFAMLMRRKIGIRERELLSESINSTHIGGIVRLTKKIMIGTAIFEGAGAVALSFRFIPDFGFWKGLWTAVFTSVSAFCNAGFDLMGRLTPYASLSPYADDILVNVTVMLLIVIGGIGFLVWDDLSRKGLRISRYQLHTKIVLTVTFALIFFGAAAFFLLERRWAADMSWTERILTSFFDAITPRTAGFNTTDTGALTDASKLLTCILMFIGGSPGSTAGGIKTTTLAVLLVYGFSYIRQKPAFGMFGRRLEVGSLQKAATVFFTNLLLMLLSAIVIAGMHHEIPLADILFECSSAIGTAGMTTGITRELLPAAQYLLVLLMYCGRVGSLSFATALSTRRRRPKVMDPVEKITIG